MADKKKGMGNDYAEFVKKRNPETLKGRKKNPDMGTGNLRKAVYKKLDKSKDAWWK